MRGVPAAVKFVQMAMWKCITLIALMMARFRMCVGRSGALHRVRVSPTCQQCCWRQRVEQVGVAAQWRLPSILSSVSAGYW